MSDIPPRKRFWTRMVLVAVIPMAVALYIGVHFILMRLGIAREYGWSFWRVGHKEISQSIAGLHYWRRPILSGPVFIFRGEKLHIVYHVRPDADSTGKLWMRISPLFGNESLWRQSFSKRADGRADVRLDTRHFYMIGFSYKEYTGTAAIDWSVR
jgi:hypothetical protein